MKGAKTPSSTENKELRERGKKWRAARCQPEVLREGALVLRSTFRVSMPGAVDTALSRVYPMVAELQQCRADSGHKLETPSNLRKRGRCLKLRLNEPPSPN